jgi:hypothetical protein
MDERDLLFIRIQLEALVSEREAMIADNLQRAHLGQPMAYCEDSFLNNANSINALRGRF